MRKLKDAMASVALLAISVIVALGVAEATLRFKNSSMTNYNIEMWRYARELKVKSSDPALDFDHAHSRSSVLQRVEVRLDEWGLRGGPVEPVPPGGRRILVLGGSVAMGWGVPEDSTVEAQLQQMLNLAGEKAQVLNGAVGNYNAQRYVTRFFGDFTKLDPTDILVIYFLRDAEELEPGGGNLLLRHSELAVTLWEAAHEYLDVNGEASLVDHYRKVYQPNAPGFLVMKTELERLADYAKEHGIRLYLAMVPDTHDLVNYEFGFAHDMVSKIAEQDGYRYVDTLPAMRGLTPQQVWVLPGDVHPNALGHRKMAEAIFPVLALSNRAAALSGQ